MEASGLMLEGDDRDLSAMRKGSIIINQRRQRSLPTTSTLSSRNMQTGLWLPLIDLIAGS
jgi:hypothetical protein